MKAQLSKKKPEPVRLIPAGVKVDSITVGRSVKQSYQWQVIDTIVQLTATVGDRDPEEVRKELMGAVDAVLQQEVVEQNANLRHLAKANSHD